jgi:hypothetical protein
MRLILCGRAGAVWFGSAASFGDTRMRLEGVAPVHLADEVQLFDCVLVRYDGGHFWFDEIDSRHDPAASAYLRASLNERLEPERLDRRGLTAEERAAYEVAYWESNQAPQAGSPRNRRRAADRERPALDQDLDPVRGRLRESLSHAGAELIDYLERPDSFRVTFAVGGQRHTSSVNKEDLTVHVAGICLSGEDQKFDLGSLVGVLREASGSGEIVPVGDENYGMDEDAYWRVHPPR